MRSISGLTSKDTARKTRPGHLQSSSKPARHRKSYDFSISEELFGLIVAAVTVYAFRGLYDGTALVVGSRTRRHHGVSGDSILSNFSRSRFADSKFSAHRAMDESPKLGGWAVFLFCVWFAFNIHSCFVQYHRYRGREHLNRIAVTWPELLAGQTQNASRSRIARILTRLEQVFNTPTKSGSWTLWKSNLDWFLQT